MKIAIYGASGTTGALIAHELADRGADLVLAGRDAGKLEALAAELGGATAVAAAAADDVLGLLAAFRGSRVVVACAGPFGTIATGARGGDRGGRALPRHHRRAGLHARHASATRLTRGADVAVISAWRSDRARRSRRRLGRRPPAAARRRRAGRADEVEPVAAGPLSTGRGRVPPRSLDDPGPSARSPRSAAPAWCGGRTAGIGRVRRSAAGQPGAAHGGERDVVSSCRARSSRCPATPPRGGCDSSP
jgi:hypothetical protein